MIRGLRFTTKGGPGSGNFGHAGRPGSVGGSAASSGGYLSSLSDLGMKPGEYLGASQTYNIGPEEIGYVNELISKIPEKFRNVAEGYTFNPMGGPNDDLSKVWITAFVDPRKKSFNISRALYYPDSASKNDYVFFHELGHVVHIADKGQLKNFGWERAKQVIDHYGHPHSDRSKGKLWGEGFADAFGEFLTNPERMKQELPEVHSFFTEK